MALTLTTVQIRTSAGGIANVAAATDGTNTYLLHLSVDASGNILTPAQDATMQQATTALQALATTLSSAIKTDPGTF